MTMLKVYMDESGTHNGAAAITVGAVWATPSVWENWEIDWNQHKQPINVHHSVDCNGRKGEFKGWTKEEVDSYVKRILPVITAHGIEGRIAGLHLNSYYKAIEIRPDVRSFLGSPYRASFQWVTNSVCEQILKTGQRDIAFIHEENQYVADARTQFEFVKSKFQQLNMSFEFGQKTSSVPLQCADILAYEGYKWLGNTYAEPRKPLDAINPDGSRIGYACYDEHNMPSFISSMCDAFDHLARTGSLPKQGQ
jgi:Protein of unknown function (DUF3800)